MMSVTQTCLRIDIGRREIRHLQPALRTVMTRLLPKCFDSLCYTMLSGNILAKGNGANVSLQSRPEGAATPRAGA
jgi:hypothetical protein